MISLHISYYINTLFDYLLWLTEEAVWAQLLGDRLFQLLKRYFSNDIVFFGLIYYITPLIGQPITELSRNLKAKFLNYWYCTIKISEKEEDGYQSIEGFVASQLIGSSLRNAEAKVKENNISGRHYYDYIPESQQMAPKLELFPADKNHEFVYDGHKFWVNVSSDSDDNQPRGGGNQLSEMLSMLNQSHTMSITMRTRDVNVLRGYLEEWLQIQFEKRYGKMIIYKSCASGYHGQGWVQLCAKELRPLDSVLLKEGQKETLFKDIQIFRQRKEWYNSLGIPYRRGILLYGPPGTGKTSLVQSIASQLKMNVAILSITSRMDDEAVQHHLRTLPFNTILLIEDIDHCQGFKASKSGTQNGENENDSNNSNSIGQDRVTMSGLLNAMDGVVAQEGSIVFMTCNDPSDIEPALLRPGRIDMKLELSYADKTQIRAMYIRFMTSYESEPEPEPLVDNDKALIELDPTKEKTTMDQSTTTSPILTPSSSTEFSTLSSSSSTTSIHTSSLEEEAERFTTLIPSNHVTPAELQNFFITYLDIIQQSDHPFEQITQLIPKFLDTVQHDRDHAKKLKNEA